MGVTGLLGLLKSIQKTTHLKQFQGKIIGVDAYGWLHRGAIACAVELAQGKPTSKYVDFAMHRVRMLRHFGAIPYIVFDGDRLPSKANTEQGRAQRRREARTSGLELLRMGRSAQAYQELQKAVEITPEMARELIEVLRHEGVKYVVAPYEADSQLVYLENRSIIDAILSEDSDMLVFGAKCLLTKLDQYGECVMIRRNDFTACRDVNLTGWTNAEFRTMCILNGCDYLEGIPKMGLRTSHRLVRKYKTIDKILRALQLEGKMKVPERYLEDFCQAENTFLYQWVFCPEVEEMVNLTKPINDNQLDGLTYIGEYCDPHIARQVASGDLNPMTKETIIFAKENVVKHLRTANLGRSKSMAVENDTVKSKSITNFFKPNRSPLAELDPNSLKPSMNAAEWTADPAPQRPYSALIRSSTDSSIRPLQRSIHTAPQANKRQRLCADDTSPSKGNDKVERSPFFAPPNQKNTLTSIRQPTRKKTRVNEFDIWSDDSIEEALASIPEKKAGQSSIQPTKQNSLEVFKDSEECQINGHTSTVAKTVNVSRSKCDATPLGSALLDEAEELRLHRSGQLKVFNSNKSLASTTTTVARERDNESLRTTHDSVFPPLSGVPAAIIPGPTALVEASPAGGQRRSLREGSVTPTQRSTNSLRPEPFLVKGSEDFIVHDSDAGSEVDIFAEEDRVPTSSPLRSATPLASVRAIDESEEAETPRRMLNLSRFAFDTARPLSAR